MKLMNNQSLSGLLLGVVAVFCTGVILLELRSVLLPFAVAMLLSIIFKPIVIHLRARRIPTAVGLVSVLLVMALSLALVGWIVYASTAGMIRELPRYEAQVSGLVARLEAAVTQIATGLGVEREAISWTSALDVTSVTSALTAGVGSFLSFLGFVFLVLLFMMFILAGSGDLAAKVRRGFPSDQAERIARIVSVVDDQVRTYLVTKTIVSLGTGVLSYLVLVLLGVDFPLVWGFLAFILNFIPNFGSLAAVILPVSLAGLQFESVGMALLTMVLLATCQTVMGNIVEPRMMGFRLNQSPLFILVSLIFWGWLWGMWGMVLAVPLTSTIKILLEHVDSLRPLAILMSGRPPGPDIVPADP